MYVHIKSLKSTTLQNIKSTLLSQPNCTEKETDSKNGQVFYPKP